jgi:hypothetical protein
VEVKAELREERIVARAEASDLGPGDLVVVEADVALFARRNE